MSVRKAFSFDDILLIPRCSNLNSRSECNLWSAGYNLPLMMSPMDTITTIPMIRYFLTNRLGATLHRYFKSVDEQLDVLSEIKSSIKYSIWISVGSVKKYQYWIDRLMDNGYSRFIVDMAHGDCELCQQTIEYIKQDKLTKVIAGNVVTKSGFDRLQSAGADGIRVGIGSGSICSTRLNTGFGVPQFTAIEDCARYKKGNTFLIADGGIRYPGDIAKAMKAGADLVMCGKMLAGTSLAGGEGFDKNRELIPVYDDPARICYEDIYYKSYRGMASKKARQGVLSYASIEGVSGLVPYIGETDEVINDIKLNLQAAMSYAGVTNWDDFRRYVKYNEVSNSSILESNTHVIGEK